MIGLSRLVDILYGPLLIGVVEAVFLRILMVLVDLPKIAKSTGTPIIKKQMVIVVQTPVFVLIGPKLARRNFIQSISIIILSYNLELLVYVIRVESTQEHVVIPIQILVVDLLLQSYSEWTVDQKVRVGVSDTSIFGSD